MERQKDMTLEDKPPWFIDVQNTTGEDQRNSSRKRAGPKWKQCSVVDVSGGESKVQCYKEQCRGMVWGRRREEGSGWGTHVYLWWIHFDIWKNQYNIVKLKNKIKKKEQCIYRNLFLDKCAVCARSLSGVQLFATPWTVIHQAPLSMGFFKQEYWSGLPFPPPGDLPDQGIKPTSPVLARGFFNTAPS